MKNNLKKYQRLRRKIKISSKIRGASTKPRLIVFKSAKHIYAQIINDQQGKTLTSASDLELAKNQKTNFKNKIEAAIKVGALIAQKAKKIKITKIVFDRGGFKFHGRIKALAEAARKAGLKF